VGWRAPPKHVREREARERVPHNLRGVEKPLAHGSIALDREVDEPLLLSHGSRAVHIEYKPLAR
jgi:hypothetical protein